jgi:hypothetical protein
LSMRPRTNNTSFSSLQCILQCALHVRRSSGTKHGARREGLEGKALMVPIDPGRHRVQGAPESPPRYRPRLRCRLRTPSTPDTATRHIHAVPVQQAYLFKATVQSIKDYDEDWRARASPWRTHESTSKASVGSSLVWPRLCHLFLNVHVRTLSFLTTHTHKFPRRALNLCLLST